MRAEICTAIEKLGTELTPALIEGSRALFADRVPRPAPELCRVERDIFYGKHARHRLDVFRPVQDGAPRMVIVFVHGGGFVAGDKGAPQAPFYNNVGVWAVQHGLIGVTMNYRLAPDAPWPAGAEDVAAVVDWLSANVGRFGGNPQRIVLMGQSAGAVHVACHLAGHHGRPTSPAVLAAVLLSGVYDLLTLKHGPPEAAYFGTDRSRFAAQSSAEALPRVGVPCVFAVSEFDPAFFQQQAARLQEVHWAATGKLARMLFLQGHNHLSPVLQLGTPGDNLGGELLTFIERFASK
jgi:triacylglycerol lipase